MRKTEHYVRSELKKEERPAGVEVYLLQWLILNQRTREPPHCDSFMVQRLRVFLPSKYSCDLDFLESEKPSICIYYTTLLTVFLLALQASN